MTHDERREREQIIDRFWSGASRPEDGERLAELNRAAAREPRRERGKR